MRTIRDEDERRPRDGRTWFADDTECIAETRHPDGTLKALLVLLDGEETWVPYSVVHDDSEVYGKGNEGRLVVAFWWAKSRGLVEDDDS